jgi:adenylate cyclase
VHTLPLAIGDIARRLGVNNILRGNLQRSNGRLRVTAQLVNAQTGRDLWSQQFDRDVGDIFEIQEEITKSVAAALRVRLAAGTAARAADTGIGTRQLEALDAYWKGILEFRMKSSTSMEQALVQFRLAVERDPQFGEAHTGVARTLLHQMMWFGIGDPPQVIAQAEQHLSQAKRLNPNLVEVHETTAEILAMHGPATGMRNWYANQSQPRLHLLNCR